MLLQAGGSMFILNDAPWIHQLLPISHLVNRYLAPCYPVSPLGEQFRESSFSFVRKVPKGTHQANQKLLGIAAMAHFLAFSPSTLLPSTANYQSNIICFLQDRSLIRFKIVAWGYTCPFWGHNFDSTCSSTFSCRVIQGTPSTCWLHFWLFIDSLSFLLRNWIMFPGSCIYKR